MLETLGLVETDYKHLTITFRINGVMHTLQRLEREAKASNIEVIHNKEYSGLQGMVFFLIQPKSLQQLHILQRSKAS